MKDFIILKKNIFYFIFDTTYFISYLTLLISYLTLLISYLTLFRYDIVKVPQEISDVNMIVRMLGKICEIVIVAISGHDKFAE